MDDLELIESSQVESHLRAVEEDVARRIKMREQSLKNSLDIREKTIIHTGRILHIDGDKKYSEKSNIYYNNAGEKKSPVLFLYVNRKLFF